MRQLKLTSIKDRLTPAEFIAYEADQAQALPLLRSLAAVRPLDANEEEHFPFVISVATQYRGRGVNWAALLRAGYEALEKNLTTHDGQGEKS